MGIAGIGALGYAGMGSFGGGTGIGPALDGLSNAATTYSALGTNATESLFDRPVQSWDMTPSTSVTLSADGLSAGAGLADSSAGANMSDLAQALILALTLRLLETPTGQ